jgi:hypothetical protein
LWRLRAAGLGRLIATTIVVIARTTWRVFAQTFGSMGFRTRFAVILAIFILMGDGTSALASIANGLSVLAVAGLGLWMIATAPFRRQHRR